MGRSHPRLGDEMGEFARRHLTPEDDISRPQRGKFVRRENLERFGRVPARARGAAVVRVVLLPADAEQVQARLAAAARASTVGRVAEEGVSWPAFLAAMGGWLGIAEALLPGLFFLGLHLATGELLLSVAAPAVLAVVLLVVRLVRRQPISGALAGLFGLVISGFIALRSGEGVDYFVLGLWTNAVYGTGVLLTMLADAGPDQVIGSLAPITRFTSNIARSISCASAGVNVRFAAGLAFVSDSPLVVPLLPVEVKPLLLLIEACVVPPPTVAALSERQRSRTTFGMAPSVRSGEIFTTSPD